MAKQAAYTERMASNVVVREVEGDICEIDQTIISRSVYVTGFQNKTAEQLIIHFQREENGGRDIEKVMVSKKGTAVITFCDPKVASSVLQHTQVLTKDEVPLTVKPCLNTLTNKCDQFEIFQVVSADLDMKFVDFVSHDQTKALLSDIAEKTGVQYIEKAENFTISGSFQQVQATRNILKQFFGQFNGTRFFCGLERKDDPTPEGHLDKLVIDSEAENREDVNQNERLKASEDEANYSSEKPADNIDENASFRSPKIETFEVEAKIFQVISKAHDKKLKNIESKCHVEIPRKTEGGKLKLKPKDSCSMDQYEEACNKFTELYRKAFLLINREAFFLKDENQNARQAITKVRKSFPISVEKSQDRSHWEMYGEASHIEEALKTLKQEGIEIIREKENAVGEKGRRMKLKDDDEAMDLDPAKHARDTKPSGEALETYLGKVKVSVYKGDITSEQVDVIVNAANRDLQHIGGVAKAILDKGGKTIQKESQAIIKKCRYKFLRDGETVTTASGNLPCKRVVHAVGPIWHEMGPINSQMLLRQACLSSFEECQAHEMKSIALPAIGSGAFGMPKNVCARVMFETMEEFIRKGDPKKQSITDIRFVNIDDATVQAFSREFMFRYDDNPPAGAKGGTFQSQSQSNRGRNPKGNAIKGSHSAPSHHSSSFVGSDHPLSFSDNAGNAATSFSDALKRGMGENDGRLPPGAGAMKDKVEENCPICLDTLTNPKTLRCKHVFCSGCLQNALAVCNKCPLCQELQGVLTGNQPTGEMWYRFERSSVPGYEGNGMIIIDYRFPSGIQGSEHPHPHQYYDGTSRTAFLPDTSEGREVLQLLRRAFDARLVFTIGTSITTGRSNQVIWNDIHHKTSVYGGTSRFGYPDPDYLRRVKEELAAKGIR